MKLRQIVCFNQDRGSPINIEGRIHVPIRVMADTLGYEVIFENGITYITKDISSKSPITPWDY